MSEAVLLTADDLLACYRTGVFPMGEGRDDPELYLVDPPTRGVFPLDAPALPRRLLRTVRADLFAVTVDTAFDRVVELCAASAPGREETWINAAVRRLYGQLHRRGAAHSVECRRPATDGGELVGGLYGVSLGAAFFGESMFSRAADASKVAMAFLVARLRRGGYSLLDCQFITDHLASLGAIEIGRGDYRVLLDEALSDASAAAPFPAGLASGDFFALDLAAPPCTAEAVSVSGPISGTFIAQLLGQTS